MPASPDLSFGLPPDALPPPASFLPTLYRIAALPAHTEDPRSALESILALVIEALGASSGSISLLNPDTGRLEIEVQQGLPLDYDEVVLRLGQGVTGWVAFHGRPLLIPDVSADPRYIRLRAEARAEMAVPLEDNGQVVGVINLDSDTLGGFSSTDLALLIRYTTEAASVTKRLWQLRQLQGKARQLESLIGIGQSLVGKLEQQELFDSLTRDGRRIIDGPACALYLFDPEANTLRLVSFAGPETPGAPGPLAHQALPIDSCALATVLHIRKQIEYADIQSADFLDVVDLPRGPRLRSMLAAPLLYEGEVLGVIALFTEHVHRFNNDEKRLVAALASLGAVALQNVRLYARVFRSEALLRKSEQLTTLGLLAAEIAHEIRNPLTVIKLLFGSLGLEFAEGDPRRTDIRLIGEKLDQLEAIVTRVLHFAKAPSSVHSRWPLASILEDTIVLIRLKLAQTKIQLQYTPPAPSLVIDVHKGQIQQVLLNLLLNATQAMPDGGTITLHCTEETRSGSPRVVHVDVADTGTGIPESIRPHIFDSFLSGRPDGTGLGLAIAKRILLSHHGDITLLRAGAEGTTLRLTLPLAEGHS